MTNQQGLLMIEQQQENNTKTHNGSQKPVDTVCIKDGQVDGDEECTQV